MQVVERVSVITIERDRNVFRVKKDKIHHFPLMTSNSWMDKLFDRSRVYRVLEQIQEQRPVELVMARSSLAAWLSMCFCERYSIPLTVESFEPHADYMLESGVWTRLDPRYQLMQKAERKQRSQARYLLPVTNKFGKHLVEEFGVNPERIRVMPCCVDTRAFAFCEEMKDTIRQALRIPQHSTVAIYTGKIGGIYLEEEAIELFRMARTYFNDLFLIVLSPQQEAWKQTLEGASFDSQSYFVTHVAHDEVADYCSAADFAFSLHRPGSTKMGISPIKNGEFLAAGLPVVLPEGIGDDSDLITQNKLGATFKLPFQKENRVFNSISEILSEADHRSRISSWAAANRSFDIVKNNYEIIFQGLSEV